MSERAREMAGGHTAPEWFYKTVGVVGLAAFGLAIAFGLDSRIDENFGLEEYIGVAVFGGVAGFLVGQSWHSMVVHAHLNGQQARGIPVSEK
jgi:hypothetical protein